MRRLPVPDSMYERAVMFDTSALEAMLDRSERYHDAVRYNVQQIRAQLYPTYITSLTIAETFRRLLYKRGLGYDVALSFLDSIYDGTTNIVRCLEADEQTALGYIKRFNDQPLTLTDAMSMAVMARLGIKQVCTLDWHFTLLGFYIIPGVVN